MRWLALVVVLGACSESVPDSPTHDERAAFVATACPKVSTPFFYSLTKDGKTSYLFGTRHVSVNLAKFPPSVVAAFDKASALVVESDTLTPSGPAKAPKSIEDALGDDYGKYKQLVGKQIASEQNERGLVNGIVSIITLYDDFDQQLDTELQRRAKDAKREIIYLETQSDTDTIASSDDMLGVKQLQQLAKRGTRKMIRDATRKSLELYCAGEWESDTLDFLSAPLVKGRNEKWIDRLDTLATERGGVFIAVGANHVIGPQGLIDMLQKRGFKLARNPEPTADPAPAVDPAPSASPPPTTNTGSGQ